MQRLLALTQKKEKLVLGLLSGTSADGIDAALVRIIGSRWDSQLRLLAFETYPYPPELRERVLAASLPGQGTVDEICRLNVAVGECFAQAALQIIATAKIQTSEVDLIGSHGQTIHHLPYAEPIAGVPSRGTLQIGEPSVIAKRTGIITIADFRAADMALGGQGAPLVPIMDYLLFCSNTQTRGLLNLGGIANLTLLTKSGVLEEVLAFDTGPANMVVDGLMQKFFGLVYDKNGEAASRGKVHHELLQSLLKHPYFSKPIPKSTGREEFGAAFVAQLLLEAQTYHLAHEDIIATATALTAESVARGAKLLEHNLGAITELIVSGGGAHNLTLMAMLQEKFPGAKISTTEEYGVPSDAKEAMLFALLANETISGNTGNVPSVTGAREATVLGKICLP
ncbi:MAG: anhydro-N-acetylmuramic acid kinase [candidate division KSB1 bacterium]